ncbi:MAG TPA: tyrosine-protein phosphatase [Pyrinomonadaceae bacterium]|nr:tyrosine-protein phosphatase [Pyrinomonadaceae bacterium]
MIRNRLAKQRLGNLGLVTLLLLAGLQGLGTNVPAQVAANSQTTIKNFGRVNENYYRGSQPRERQMEQLKQMGIKTVIDLREDKESQSEAWASKAGLRYVNIPLRAARAATDAQAKYFLSLVNDPANFPVYVHCKGGKHRTGALTAAYRITHDGWTADQAFEEMKRYDFEDGFFGGPSGQKKFVYSFYQRYLANQPAK